MFRERPPYVAFALGVTAVLLLSAGAVRGDATVTAPGHLPISNDVAQQARRSIVWVWAGPSTSPTRGFRISSESISAPNPDEFQITYEDGVFVLDYERQAGGPVTSSFKLTVKALVEWNDAGGDELISNGSILANVPLGDTGFGAIPVQHRQASTASGTEMQSFLIVSNSGDVTMNLTMSQDFVALPSGETLTPMEAKLSFEIDRSMSHPGARIGLLLGMATPETVNLEDHSWDEEHQYSHNERALNVTNASGTSSAFFAWSSTATVNGQEGNVTVTGPEINETSGGRDIYLAYPAGPVLAGNPSQVKVIHDPTIGVVSAAFSSITLPLPPIQGDYLVYSVTVAGMAAVVLGTAVLTRRRRRER